MFQYEVLPFVFTDNNTTDLFSKCALIVFLIVSTSFIVGNTNLEDELENDKLFYSMLALILSALAIVIFFYYFARWVHLKLHPVGLMLGRTTGLILQFRDVMGAQALVSDDELLRKARGVGEADLRAMTAAMQVVLAMVLGEQPDTRLRNQRLLPGVPYKIWDAHQTTSDLLRAALDGTMRSMVIHNASGRLAVLKLATLLSGSPTLQAEFDPRQRTLHQQQTKQGDSVVRGKLRSWTTHLKHIMMERGCLGSPQQEMSFADFKAKLGNEWEGILSEQELRTVFDLLDFDDSGKISLHEFRAAMMALVPKIGTHQAAGIHSTDDSSVLTRTMTYVEDITKHEVSEPQKSYARDGDDVAVPSERGTSSANIVKEQQPLIDPAATVPMVVDAPTAAPATAVQCAPATNSSSSPDNAAEVPNAQRAASGAYTASAEGPLSTSVLVDGSTIASMRRNRLATSLPAFVPKGNGGPNHAAIINSIRGQPPSERRPTSELRQELDAGSSASEDSFEPDGCKLRGPRNPSGAESPLASMTVP
eukprot:gnl/TRDRNA2_/TRDRNA2_127046_c1_seq1.p1 gnl/TRDRNA2_/TRDRNA2_127046_c1~~gnl/TRDRNA2_/TRDRNA2_127046_c1_seq1.p1  ORF type:complete len:578 (+),score=93.77 gnl/TRDRNA2_/TRDRNA2_127046_c1_seq1:133-1734(+)